MKTLAAFVILALTVTTTMAQGLVPVPPQPVWESENQVQQNPIFNNGFYQPRTRTPDVYHYHLHEFKSQAQPQYTQPQYIPQQQYTQPQYVPQQQYIQQNQYTNQYVQPQTQHYVQPQYQYVQPQCQYQRQQYYYYVPQTQYYRCW